MERRDFLKKAGSAAAVASISQSDMFNINQAFAYNGYDYPEKWQDWKISFDKAIAKNPALKVFKGIADPNQELHTASMDIEGDLPKDIKGTYYRNGPTRHEVGAMRYHHFFDGDGMIQAFRFDGDGHISHHGKFIETQKFLNEKQANKPLYQGFGTSLDFLTADSADSINTANIHIIKYDGELLALWEGGSAHIIDENTLDTIGVKHWSNESAGFPFSAHTRVDRQGILWSFGYAPIGGMLILYRVDPGKGLEKISAIPMPNTPMIHDFIVTDNYIMFLLPPFNFDSSRDGSFLERFHWKANDTTRVLIIDKNNFEVIKQTEMPTHWIFHYSNAYEHGDNIHFTSAFYNSPDVMTKSFRDTMMGQVYLDKKDRPYAVHVSINVKTGNFTLEKQPELSFAEFPRFDERQFGKKQRYSYMLTGRQNDGFIFDSVGFVDHHNEVASSYYYGAHQIAGEHIYIPHPHKEDEESGWVIGLTEDVYKERSTLNIFNADNIAAGPICRAHCNYNIPFGLHGSFISA